jgi:putative zinc finger/helix-turn-helix YgiT family protein
MKTRLAKCGTCRQAALKPETIHYAVRLQHDGREYDIDIPDLKVRRCGNCGAVTLNDEADERISQALRHAAGLLEPSEIRRQREALGLTQRQLADYLNLAESTLSRWETGAQIQQRCLDRLLRLFFDVPEVRARLGVPVTERRKTSA